MDLGPLDRNPREVSYEGWRFNSQPVRVYVFYAMYIEKFVLVWLEVWRFLGFELIWREKYITD